MITELIVYGVLILSALLILFNIYLLEKEIWPNQKIANSRKVLLTLVLILVPFWGLVVYTFQRDLRREALFK